MTELGQGKRLDLDVMVGALEEKNLKLTVSARGSEVVLGFFNKKAFRGFEVGFSAKMVSDLEVLLADAKRKLRSTGNGT